MLHPLQSYYSRIYKTYDLVNTFFTLGMDKKWRDRAVSGCLKNKPARVLDLCCGTGDLAISLCHQASYPIQVTGYDLNEAMLGMARKKALQKGSPLPVFLEGDAADMPFEDQSFDAIIIGFGFRNLTYEHPRHERHLNEMVRILKPGGQLVILESTPPKHAFSHTLFRLYLRTVLVPLGALLSGHKEAYQYLARSSEDFYNADQLSDLLVSRGLHPSVTHTFLLGSVSLITVNR